jgi:hypothetical protein
MDAGLRGGRRYNWAATEADLVAVRVDVGGFAYTVGVGLLFRGFESTVSDLCEGEVEVVDEDGVSGMAGELGHVLDVILVLPFSLPTQ